MIPRRKKPAVLATTALMILRNRLSERVWGSCGIHSLSLDDPRPHLRRSDEDAANRFPLRTRKARTVLPREDRPSLPHPTARPRVISGVGIIGDSISDEYRFHAPDRVTARNWAEILAATRGFHFGDPAVAARGTARDRRFSYNWSESGATTTSLIARGQHTGLAAQVTDGAAIGLVAVTIGANDFADVLFTTRSVTAMGRALKRASSNIAAILDSLLGLDPAPRIAVFTAVDLRCSPLLRGALDSGLVSPTLADAYAGAIAAFNDRLHGVVADHGHRIVVVDIHRLLNEVVEAPRYVIGGVELDRIRPSNDARHLFLSDGFHSGTIGQCLVANRFLEAINARFDADIPLLGGAEIVRTAASVPKPSGLSLIGTGALALFGYGRRRPRAA